MNPREFFDRYIRGWFPAEPRMQRHWPIKPIATIVAVSISFSIIISLLSSFFFASSAIVAISQWQRTYGSENKTRYGKSLIETSDGGYAIAGRTDEFGDGGRDFWLAKTNGTGYMEWDQTYGGPKGEYGESLVATSDGGYAIAGFTESFGGGGRDFWLVKTDEFGNMEWNKTYGGGADDMARSLVATFDGGYAIAGSTSSFGADKTDFWLVKTDAYGNMEWNQTYGGTDGYPAFSLVATSDGGYAMAGEIRSLVTGHSDFQLVKTDASGNMEWNQTYGGPGWDDAAWSLVETSDGGYALAGYTRPYHYENGDLVDESSSWLVKTDALGNMEWDQTYGGASLYWALSLAVAPDGGYAIAGHGLTGDGDGDFCLVKTDEFGNMEWNKKYGGPDHEGLESLIATSDGGYALVGFTKSFGDSRLLFIKTDEYGNVQEPEQEPQP